MFSSARRLAPYYAYRTGEAIANALPRPVGSVVARSAAVAIGRAAKGRRATIARHLTRIEGSGLTGPALRREVDRAFASYGRYWLETFRLPRRSPFELEAGMVYEGIGNLELARGRGRGVIMVMPHIGAWDWGGAWLSSSGYPVTVVAEPLEPPELFELFAGWRQAVGMTVVALGPEATPAVMRTLRAGGVVGLLCDRDLAGGGVPVTFFGEETTLPGGPATLALRTGAPIVPCAVYFEGRRHRGVVGPPLDTTRQGGLRQDVGRITQTIADALAELIERAPEQWHVFQPNWPSDPGYRG